ncbi:MAG: hypothetical protein ACYCVD_15925, partial [Desulfitobacteriaceae bacterium]
FLLTQDPAGVAVLRNRNVWVYDGFLIFCHETYPNPQVPFIPRVDFRGERANLNAAYIHRLLGSGVRDMCKLHI